MLIKLIQLMFTARAVLDFIMAGTGVKANKGASFYAYQKLAIVHPFSEIRYF